jgi:hypothetical protein
MVSMSAKLLRITRSRKTLKVAIRGKKNIFKGFVFEAFRMNPIEIQSIQFPLTTPLPVVEYH